MPTVLWHVNLGRDQHFYDALRAITVAPVDAGLSRQQITNVVYIVLMPLVWLAYLVLKGPHVEAADANPAALVLVRVAVVNRQTHVPSLLMCHACTNDVMLDAHRNTPGM